MSSQHELLRRLSVIKLGTPLVAEQKFDFRLLFDCRIYFCAFTICLRVTVEFNLIGRDLIVVSKAPFAHRQLASDKICGCRKVET
jgi:hypothetical protein